MRAKEFIIEGYPEAQAEFAQASGNPATAQQLITQFRSLVNKNQVQGNERNIDWWRKQGWEPFSKFVSQKSQQPTKTQVKRQKVAGRSITLMESDKWLIVIPLDKEASCFHGKNSDWCTTKPLQPYFENYFYDRGVTLIYCLNKQTGGMWAIAAHKKLEGKIEIFDQQDRSISENTFFSQTQLSASKIVEVALGDTHQPEVEKSRSEYRESVDRTAQMIQNMKATGKVGERQLDIERELIYNKNPNLCESYIGAVLDIALPLYNGVRDREDEVSANFLPEEIVLPALQNSGILINLIKDPTERQQLAAVHGDGTYIQYIKNPTLKVQLAAIEDAGSGIINLINNPDPKIFELYPEVKNMISFVPERVFEHILPQIATLIQERGDEIFFEWEADDDYFSEWQHDQALKLGYTDEDGEVDWDRVHEDDTLNDYSEFNSEAGQWLRYLNGFLQALQNPENIVEWAHEMGDEGFEPEDMTLSNLDTIIAWKIEQDDLGSNLANQVKAHLLIEMPRNGSVDEMPKVKWVRS